MTEVFTHENFSPSWPLTLFNMLPKTSTTKSILDFRFIVNAVLLSRLFEYFMLGRMEESGLIRSGLVRPGLHAGAKGDNTYTATM